MQFAYSGTSFRPDFVIPQFSLAIEVKLCGGQESVRRVINEINADIPAYCTQFGMSLFVVYDLGCIRYPAAFVRPYESQQGVKVIVVKH